MNDVATAAPKANRKAKPQRPFLRRLDSLVALALFGVVLPCAFFCLLILVRGPEFTSAAGAIPIALWIYLNARDENLTLVRLDLFGFLVVAAFAGGAALTFFYGGRYSWLWGVAGGALSLLLILGWTRLKPPSDAPKKRTSPFPRLPLAWVLFVPAVALAVTRPVLARKPVVYYRDLGAALMKKKAFDEAVAVYTEGMRNYPGEAPFYQKRGAVYQNNLKDYDRAMADYSSDIQMHPDDCSLAYFNRAGCCSAKGEHDKAIADLTHVIRLRTWQPPYQPYYLRAQEYQAVGKDREAIADIDDAARLNPSWRRQAQPHLARARCYARMGKWPEAVSDCARAIAVEPKNVTCYIVRGEIKARMGKRDETIEDFTKAIQYAPEPSPQDYCRRGAAYAAKADYERAIDDFSDALRIDPQFVPALFQRGNCRAWKGEHDRAIEDYTEVIRLEDRHAKAYFNRGLEYRARGDRARADEDRAAALERDPSLGHGP